MLSKDVQRTGRWLFRHRSVVPAVLVPPLLFETCRNAERLAAFRELDFAWGFICMGVAFVGVVIRALVVGYAPAGTSGRSTKRQKAATLNTTGLYSLTRNPLYFGNLVVAMGVVTASRSWEFLGFSFLLFLLYYERIISVEETFLEGRFGEEYRNWSASTPWLFPRPWRWRPPGTSFLWKKVLRSEFYAAFGIPSALFVIEHARRAFITRAFELDRVWGIIWASAGALFVILRTLKKRTSLLKAG